MPRGSPVRAGTRASIARSARSADCANVRSETASHKVVLPRADAVIDEGWSVDTSRSTNLDTRDRLPENNVDYLALSGIGEARIDGPAFSAWATTRVITYRDRCYFIDERGAVRCGTRDSNTAPLQSARVRSASTSMRSGSRAPR